MREKDEDSKRHNNNNKQYDVEYSSRRKDEKMSGSYPGQPDMQLTILHPRGPVPQNGSETSTFLFLHPSSTTPLSSS